MKFAIGFVIALCLLLSGCDEDGCRDKDIDGRCVPSAT